MAALDILSSDGLYTDAGFYPAGSPCAGANMLYNTKSYDNDTTLVTEIPVDPELMASLCRRSRRRLRDIQAECQAILRPNRARCIIGVEGSAASIEAVHAHLAALWGPHRPVSAALWAELMRTRSVEDPSLSTIAQLQQASGARIHIERDRLSLRLFGSSDRVAMADELLRELDQICVQKTVQVANAKVLMSTVLQGIAESSGVTLRVDEDGIVVLGFKCLVQKAVEILASYIADHALTSICEDDANCESPRGTEASTKSTAGESQPEPEEGFSTDTDNAAVAPMPAAVAASAMAFSGDGGTGNGTLPAGYEVVFVPCQVSPGVPPMPMPVW
jgi:hypothetical protein